ncbi:MAG TPA: hypothetical protein VG498_01140, partial [Terriglobales bacterium]|nr:hypothetical protein [Terriglobales bacterium]
MHRFCRGRRSSPVFGFVDEIDLWLRSKPKQSLRYRSQPQSAQTIESELERAGAALEEAYAAYQQRLRHYIELKSAS